MRLNDSSLFLFHKNSKIRKIFLLAENPETLTEFYKAEIYETLG